MVEADRPHPPGQAPRTAQGGLDLRLQLRRTQPDAAPTADRAKTSARPQGAVRLKPAGNGLPQGSRCPVNTRKTLASNQFHRSEGTNPQYRRTPTLNFNKFLELAVVCLITACKRTPSPPTEQDAMSVWHNTHARLRTQDLVSLTKTNGQLS